jgi:iron complex outermembrane receptor protein
MRTCLRLFVALAFMGIVGALDAPPAYAQPGSETVIDFNIAPGPLEAALRKVAEERNLQILFAPEDVKGVTTPGLKGRFTAKEAIEELVKGTGLTVTTNGNNVFAIKPSGLTKERSGEGTTRSVVAETITVTGTHIRGITDTAAPILSISREEIGRTAYTTVQDLFRGLPQNFGAISMDASIATGGSTLANAAFEEPVGAIDLRGLGPQSTLVLVNGQRRAGGLSGRAVDVSSIPLSAVQRIDVITGGASAIYGSDAVAGVANLILRRTFDGAESQAYYGAGGGGLSKFNFSQALGREYQSGGFVVAYDYTRDRPLDIVRTNLNVSPSSAGYVTRKFYVTPDDDKHALYFAGQQQLSSRIDFAWDALYARKKDTHIANYTITGCCDVNGTILNTNEQFSGSGEFGVQIARDWNLRLTGARSQTDTDSSATYLFNGAGTPVFRPPKAYLNSLTSVADGSLMSMGGGSIRAAVGAEVREEFNKFPSSAVSTRSVETSRNVRSVFAEVNVPIAKTETGIQKRGLDLTVSGRFDDYSDFGSTTNPQAGVVWHAAPGFDVRGSYARAFRAPDLYSLAQDTLVVLRTRPSETGTGVRDVLIVYGGNPNLQPEKAKTWSLGFDWRIPVLPETQVSASYFNIDYRNRITVSAEGADDVFILQRAQFAPLIDRTPTAAQIGAILANAGSFLTVLRRPFGPCPAVGGCSRTPTTQEILAAAPTLFLVTNLVNNLASESLRGVDLSLRSTFQTPIGQGSLGLNGAYTIEHKRRVTQVSEEARHLNEVGKPAGLKIRAMAAVTHGPFSGVLFGNYARSYSNPYVSPAGTIASWTTFDINFQIDGGKLADMGILKKTRIALSIDNIFERDPPEFLQNSQGLRYDSANANPFGRVVALRATQVW